ncbi:hypothetical protein DFP72DRAFT_841301 [Ephemerocybe angulata]|uniref:F-box domain-containing protein n=1 Tax=Ephemerocybe angulata TaxID=980116 RepID=A0A8H6ICR4_9AGAR|nr:hypothetical protein DFP72DRAFT_841301 [Tulosesus angulatus]
MEQHQTPIYAGDIEQAGATAVGDNLQSSNPPTLPRPLPLNILGRIFLYALATSSHKTKKDLINLCLVCKLWKDAAYRTQSLWNPIEINLWGRITPQLYDTAVSWLTRSARASRTLVVRTEYTRDDCPEPGHCALADPLLAKLLTVGPALDNLHIDSKCTQCLGYLLDIMDSPGVRFTNLYGRPWDSLKSLGLTFRKIKVPFVPEPEPYKKRLRRSCKHSGDLFASRSRWDSDEDSEEMYEDHILCRLPKVENFELHLPDDYETRMVDNIVIPDESEYFSTVKNFTLKCEWRQYTVIALLQACYYVQVLTVDLMGKDTDTFVQMPDLAEPFSPPDLHTLRLRNIHPHNIGIFGGPEEDEDCEKLVIPEVFYGYVKKLSESTEHGIKRLRIRSVYVSESEDDWGPLFELLQNLPELTHLTLDKMHISASVLKEIICSGKLTPLKQLEVLELRRIPAELSPLAVCAEIGCSRANDGAAANSLPPLPSTLKKIIVSREVEDEDALCQEMEAVERSFKELLEVAFVYEPREARQLHLNASHTPTDENDRIEALSPAVHLALLMSLSSEFRGLT